MAKHIRITKQVLCPVPVKDVLDHERLILNNIRVEAIPDWVYEAYHKDQFFFDYNYNKREEIYLVMPKNESRGYKVILDHTCYLAKDSNDNLIKVSKDAYLEYHKLTWENLICIIKSLLDELIGIPIK